MTPESAKIAEASSWWSSLITSQVLEGLTKYPNLGPSVVSLSHHSRTCVSFPMAAESSAYHTCVQSPSSLLMSGMVARPYMAMARGSPWVVPSCDRMISPSMKSSVGLLYELIRIVAIGGQRRLILCKATCRLRVLNALVASTRSVA